MRRFDPSSIGSLRQFRPEALAGSLDALKQLGPAAPDRAVIVLTSLEDGSLCEAERELLWRIFEVPIFEQRIGADGSLLAWECEAHEGLHVVEENAIFEQSAQRGLLLTSLTDRRNPVIRLTSSGKATLEIKCCGCGRAGVRMIFIGNPERDLCRNPDTPVLKLSQ